MTDPIVTLANDHLTAVVSDLGAELQSLTTNGSPLLWHGDGAWWTGRSPILFPIVGRAEGDLIAVGDFTAEMKSHGFARRSLFRRVAAEPTRVRHELTATEATRAIYPFDFRLTLTHALDGKTLTITAGVENLDTAPMPFGLGFHPAFLWPLPGHEDAPHVIQLDNGAEPLLARLSGGQLTEERRPSPFVKGRLVLDQSQFLKDAMVFPEGAGAGLSYGPEDGPKLRFSFENLPNLAIWQKPGAPFICIEPWHGMAAIAGAGPQIADRPYSLTLAPGDSVKFSLKIVID
ncbi:aldose 1-epimerase family protein [Paenirhodobacter populi]|uniref:Aldose 1-epimerase family protein n=1 Tax=Paenirhodobacter populi TaxID=2306993 RepID=A0A443JPV4_9RHOB|nr:aldose 1-epimerase family protein [Sinirhodobacter populi]RWR22489.1 aldose 1-epimerase family protein [Sinirhodobacter populi]